MTSFLVVRTDGDVSEDAVRAAFDAASTVLHELEPDSSRWALRLDTFFEDEVPGPHRRMRAVLERLFKGVGRVTDLTETPS
jgi:hypothetical protein